MKYTNPSIWTLLDSSGSIGTKELKVFLSEVKNIAKQSPVHVIFWDTEPYGPYDARKEADVFGKVARHARGGGGTSIKKTLLLTKRSIKAHDIVVVFTDGYQSEYLEFKYSSDRKHL